MIYITIIYIYIKYTYICICTHKHTHTHIYIYTSFMAPSVSRYLLPLLNLDSSILTPADFR